VWIYPQPREKISSLWERARRRCSSPTGLAVRPRRLEQLSGSEPEDWHNYCMEYVIRGDEPEKFAGFQVGIGLSPRLPHLVERDEAEKELETDGSHCKKGI
jgi:hypothetical protein